VNNAPIAVRTDDNEKQQRGCFDKATVLFKRRLSCVAHAYLCGGVVSCKSATIAGKQKRLVGILHFQISKVKCMPRVSFNEKYLDVDSASLSSVFVTFLFSTFVVAKGIYKLLHSYPYLALLSSLINLEIVDRPFNAMLIFFSFSIGELQR